MTSTFETNIASLPETIRSSFVNGKISDNIITQNAFNGSPTIAVSVDGVQSWLHSQFSPESTDFGRFKEASLNGKKNWLILGFGLGYHIDSAMKILQEKFDGNYSIL